MEGESEGEIEGSNDGKGLGWIETFLNVGRRVGDREGSRRVGDREEGRKVGWKDAVGGEELGDELGTSVVVGLIEMVGEKEDGDKEGLKERIDNWVGSTITKVLISNCQFW